MYVALPKQVPISEAPVSPEVNKINVPLMACLDPVPSSTAFQLLAIFLCLLKLGRSPSVLDIQKSEV